MQEGAQKGLYLRTTFSIYSC